MGQVCVYVSRTCNACASMQCVPSGNVGATADSATPPAVASTPVTLWVIVGACAFGSVAAIATAGLIWHRQRQRKLAKQRALAELEQRSSIVRLPDGTPIAMHELDDQDLLDELGMDPLGARIRIRTSTDGRLTTTTSIGSSSRAGGGMGGGLGAPTSIFEPPMLRDPKPGWRRSAESSIYSISPNKDGGLLAAAGERGSVLFDIPRSPSPASLAPPIFDAGESARRNPFGLRVDTGLAANGARNKGSLDRARTATSARKLGAGGSDTNLLLAANRSAPPDGALLPALSPSVARFSFASISTALDNGAGLHPVSSGLANGVYSAHSPGGGGGGLLLPMSPVPAHPPPAIPIVTSPSLVNGTSSDDACRVDDWWRTSGHARSNVFNEQGRPCSTAYSDASSHADSVVHVAGRTASTLLPLQPVVLGSVTQLRASGILMPKASMDAPTANPAQNAYLALSQRRTDAGGEGAPPTGSVYGMV